MADMQQQRFSVSSAGKPDGSASAIDATPRPAVADASNSTEDFFDIPGCLKRGADNVAPFAR